MPGVLMQYALYLSAISLMGSFSVYASSCGEIAAMDERLLCYDNLAQCSSVKSDAKRLACFESTTVSKQEPIQIIPETSPLIASTGAPQTRAESRDELIETRISNTRMNRSEVLFIYLENGQVWKEITRSRFRYKKGQKVTITRSPLGSARLHAEGMKKYAKVSLVKA